MRDQLIDSIKKRDYRVGIIGLGYVGLPLMWTFFQQKFPVIGFDVDEEKIRNIRQGKTYIKHFNDSQIAEMATSDRCEVTTDFSRVADVDAVLMCVPTPLDEHREPDMTYVVKTVESIAPHLKKGQLVVLESTTYPGTTEEVIKPLCEKYSGLVSGEDLLIAYSPEREDPGNANFKTATIPKVVGGDGDDALAVAKALYDEVIVDTVPVSNPRTAEAVKLLENIFRSVNIALVNELKMVFQQMDIDIFEVVNAAKTKPFGFMAFYPGPGLGGHCIPIDPFYLTWKAREYDIHTRFIELAGEVNTHMPHYVVQRTMEALNSDRKSLNGSRVLCIGLSYKPDVDDMRESPTFILMDKMDGYGAEVDYYDPIIKEVKPTREHPHWTGKQSIEWSKEAISGYDAVLIATNHSTIDYDELLEWSRVIIDTRNVYGDGLHNHQKVFKA